MSAAADFGEVHEELRSVARDLLSRTGPLAGGAQGAEPGWDSLAAAGWLGLEAPEDLGGAGATFAEVAVVVGEMGRVMSSMPYFGSAVLGVGLLGMLEPGAERDELMHRVTSGTTRLAVAVPADDDAVGGFTPPFGLEGSTLSGELSFVLDGVGADVLMVVAHDRSGATVAIALPASRLEVHDQPVVDPTRRLARVEAHRVELDSGTVWHFAPGRQPVELLDRGAVAVACDSLGLAQGALNATVEYARMRHQFGRPIGSFQAVKHACADMLVQVRLSEALVAEAVRAVASDPASAAAPVSRAKSYATAAAVEVAGKAMQLHGGIGYTWERGIHFYLKRAALNRSLFGSPAAHRRRLFSLLG